MEARLFLLHVICQTVIRGSLGGVTLPFSDLVGKVTPIKPKPLSPSTVSSLSSSICGTNDIMPKPFSSTSGVSTFQEFSAPLIYTSTSRALPVPKIDALSIADVKLPERLREKFLSPKLCDASVRMVNPDIRSPEVLLPYKYPFLSSPSKLSNTFPGYSLSNIYPTTLNKLTPLPSITSLPVVPVETLKTSNVLAPPTCKLPLTLESRQPLLSEQCTINNLYPSSSSCSLPYPLYYKSMYLPGVRTPSDMLPLNYVPISYTETRNFNSLGQFNVQKSVNMLSERNKLFTLPCLNPITSSEISQNMIQVPKISSNVPFLMKPVFPTQNAAIQNLWSSFEPNPGYTSVPPKCRFEPSESLLSSSDLRKNKDIKSLLSALSCILVDKITELTPKPLNPPKISLAAGPSTSLNECSRKFNIPNMYPVKDSYVKPFERVNCNDLTSRITFDNIPSFRQINVPDIYNTPLIPATMSNQYPLMPDRYISNIVKYSPPIIPREPIPTISFGPSDSSPMTYCPSRTALTPSIPYINQPTSASIAQSTSKMVSSINDLMSNVAQNILTSCKCMNSAPQDVSQKPKYTLKSNPYADAVLKPQETPSVVLTLPQPILPIISSSIDINPPVVDTSTILSIDMPCKSSVFEFPSSQCLPISTPQALATAILPVTSLISFSSPQLCPSYLPSPTLPTYPSLASPFYMEAPVFKVNSSKKDSEIEKLIELMLVAEILNNDESFDWDDLDTLLAFLSLS